MSKEADKPAWFPPSWCRSTASRFLFSGNTFVVGQSSGCEPGVRDWLDYWSPGLELALIVFISPTLNPESSSWGSLGSILLVPSIPQLSREVEGSFYRSWSKKSLRSKKSLCSYIQKYKLSCPLTLVLYSTTVVGIYNWKDPYFNKSTNTEDEMENKQFTQREL